MERVRTLAQFWGWLPAFRAVAETEHLPSAAASMGISAPALSRTVHLLEDALGHELLTREGRGLRLTDAGRSFLDMLRQSMRTIDEAVRALSEEDDRRPLRILASESASIAQVMPALSSYAQRGSELNAELEILRDQDIASLLKRGQVDLALTETPFDPSGLRVEVVATQRYAVYGGRRRRRTDVVPPDAPFAAPRHAGLDRWPPNVPRRIALRTASIFMAIEAAASGRFFAFLPTRIGDADPRLQRFSSRAKAAAKLYAVYRPPIAGAPAPIADFVAHLKTPVGRAPR